MMKAYYKTKRKSMLKINATGLKISASEWNTHGTNTKNARKNTRKEHREKKTMKLEIVNEHKVSAFCALQLTHTLHTPQTYHLSFHKFLYSTD